MEGGMNWSELFSLIEAGRVLVGVLAYVLGATLIASSFVRLKRISAIASMGRTHTGDGTYATVAMGLLGGLFLIYLPSTVGVGGTTIFGTNALAYGETGAGGAGSFQAATLIIRYVELTGLIAMVHGFWLLKDFGERGGHGQSVGGKIVGYVTAGLFAYNVVPFVGAISSFIPFNPLEALGVAVQGI
jgi:hypothetical protein